MKKLISVFLVLVMILSAAPLYTMADRSERAEDILTQLDVLIPIDEDNPVTRAYAVASIINLIGQSELAAPVSEQGDKTYYKDVPLTYWALEDINIAYDLGIISYSPEGMFYPDIAITYEQLAKMLLVTMGYESQANQYGGFPTGYMIVAGNTGIFDGLTITDNKGAVKLDDFARILCNVLDCEIFYQSVYGQFPEYSQDKTFAEGMLGLTKKFGLLNATDETALSADRHVAKGYVEIDNILYKDLTSFASRYLGIKVVFYINNDNEIVCIVPSSENSVIELDTATSYFGFSESNREFEYEDEYGVTRTVEISNVADVIYNGKNYIGYPTDVFDFETGYIRLVDNGSDGVYETVFITSYTAYQFEYYDYQLDLIYTSDGDALDVSKNVEIYDLKGNLISFEDITKGDVLSVASSLDGEYTEIIVCDEYRMGKIASYETGNAETWVNIGNDENFYKVSETLKDKVNSNSFGTFYLDFKGNVVFYRYQETEYQYGYLVTVGNGGGIDDTLKFKVVTQYGTVVVFSAANMFTLDGDKYSKTGSPKSAGVSNALVVLGAENADSNIVPTLIRYKLNDNGEIVAIDSPNASKSQSEMKVISEGNAIYRDNAASMNGKVYVGGCMAFVVPDDKLDTDNYIVTSASRMAASTYYDYIAYSVNSKYSADALVIEGTDNFKKVSYDNAFAMVEKVSKTLVNDNEAVKLSLYTNKTVTEVIVVDPEVQKTALSIEAGDVIQYSTNANNEVMSIRCIYDKSNEKFCNYGTLGARVEYSFGYITDREDTVIGFVKGSVEAEEGDAENVGTMVYPSLEDDELVYSLHYADIVLFDSTAREGYKVKRITPQEINEFKCTVVMNIGYSRVKSLYIYK